MIMKQIIALILGFLLFIGMAGFEFQLRPFKLKLNDWELSLVFIGIIFLVSLAIGIAASKAEDKGYNKAYDEIEKMLEDNGLALKNSESFNRK